MRRLRAIILLAACAAPLGTGSCRPAAEEPLLRLAARGLRFTLPPEVAAGLTRVRFVNQDPVWHEASLVRFTSAEGTLERYIALARSGEEYPAFAEDLGGVSFLAPGDSAEVLIRLPPGRYAVICWHQDHVLQGMGAEFEVRGDRMRWPDPAQATPLPLRDFAIPPLSPRPGHELLHVTNDGPSEHELAILRLDAGRTLADFMAWRTAGEAGPPPGRTIAGTAALRSGAEVWLDVTWAPGRYAVICLLEDPAKRYHTQLGMQREFTIP